MADTNKVYANFNTVTFQGRVFNAEVVDAKSGSFLAITVITNPVDDSEGVTVTFNNSNGLMALHQKGFLPKGRMVTVTGHIASVSEVYTTKEGEVKLRKRPNIHLTDASIPTGGLGAMPADKVASKRPAAGTVVMSKTAEAPAVDATPDMAEMPY